MKKKRTDKSAYVGIRLHPLQLDDVDKAAADLGVGRSEYLRLAAYFCAHGGKVGLKQFLEKSKLVRVA